MHHERGHGVSEGFVTEARFDSGETALSEVQQGSGYTVVGIVEDGADLNQAVWDLRRAGIEREDLTVVLKRRDPDELEPFPEGTRYIVVPDDSRGLEIPISYAIVFVASALLFAFTAHQIAAVLFIFFIGVAAVLVASTFSKVGVMPILIDMEAPAEESGFWNDEFEKGKVLLFASTARREVLRDVWRIFQERGTYFDVIERRLVPRALSGAVLHGEEEAPAEEKRVKDTQELKGG